jgi:hypothetical protein
VKCVMLRVKAWVYCSGGGEGWRGRGGGGSLNPPASPMLRVKAVPGYIPFGNHRRGGSPSSSSSVVQASTVGSFKPSIWSSVKTLAPACFTRSHSSRLHAQKGGVRGQAMERSQLIL